MDTQEVDTAKDILLLLWYLDQLQPKGKTQFQKVMFFAERELVEAGICFPTFKYFRYHHGPFSKELEVALSQLRQRKYARADEKSAKLTNDGETLAEELTSQIPETPTNQKILGTIGDWIEKLRGKNFRELETLAYNTEIRPLDALPWEEDKTLRDVEQNRDLLDP